MVLLLRVSDRMRPQQLSFLAFYVSRGRLAYSNGLPAFASTTAVTVFVSTVSAFSPVHLTSDTAVCVGLWYHIIVVDD